MNEPILFETGRRRPASISNTNCCYSDAEIEPLLAARDEQLDWRAFKIIFSTSGCTAIYTQQVYFLPWAIKYLHANPDAATECSGDLVYFLSQHVSELQADQLLLPALAGVRACISDWTSTFSVVHYDTAACRAKEWRLDHADSVVNSWALCALTDYLLRYKTHGILVDEMLGRWLQPGRSDICAAWLLEYARSQREAFAAFGDPSKTPAHLNMTPAMNASSIYSAVVDCSLLQNAYRQAQASVVPLTASPTYWPDLMVFLELGGAA